MFGVKINEFDNSNGTIDDFNRIFPNTQLEGIGDVEILDIVESKTFTDNVYKRNISVDGNVTEHDFGRNNFSKSDMFQVSDRVRFKYFVKDLDGNLMVTGYNYEEVSEKLNVGIGVVKDRFKNPVDETTMSKHLFNITRKEI